MKSSAREDQSQCYDLCNTYEINAQMQHTFQLNDSQAQERIQDFSKGVPK